MVYSLDGIKILIGQMLTPTPVDTSIWEKFSPSGTPRRSGDVSELVPWIVAKNVGPAIISRFWSMAKNVGELRYYITTDKFMPIKCYEV